MKKLFIGLLVIVAISIVLIYLLVPGTITVSKSTSFQTNSKGLFRTLSQTRNWSKWWPGQYDTANNKLLLGDNTYSVSDFTATSILIDIHNTALAERSTMVFVPLQGDSIQIDWEATIPTSYNPVKRLQVYLAAARIQHDLNTIIAAIPSYYTNDEKIYNLDIRRESVKDTSLVFTYDSTNGYPSNEKIYSMIGELREYINSHAAVATDSPMLNIYSSDQLHYVTKVAIPTNKILPSSGKIFYKWMLPHGNILVADVKGDRKKTDSAFTTMDNYVHDYNLTAPAIPFFKLMTNRLQEKDSSKWVTRIYYPVMYYN